MMLRHPTYYPTPIDDENRPGVDQDIFAGVLLARLPHTQRNNCALNV